jgi:hypothetical protein
MARVSTALTNFTGGQLSDRMEGRTDFQKYFSGCKTLENFIVQPHGSVTRRPGTTFAAEVKTSSLKTRLIPFEFSTEQSYALEFGNNYIRFYKDNGAVLEANKTITGITQANPGVVTSATHGFANGDTVVITGVVGMTQVNGKRFKVASVATNTFQLQDIDGNNVNTTSYTAYTSGGIANRVYTLTTTYLTADLFNIKYAQSADVMYLCHPDYSVKKLSRTGHTSWTITEVDFSNGPFLDHNITTTTLNPTHRLAGQSTTVTASSTTGINDGNGFTSGDIGRLVHFDDGHFQITSITSTTVVVGTVIKTFTASSPSTDWALGAFSEYTGYPSCVTFYEQRLVFAGTEHQPQTLFFSKSGDYENMDDNYHGTVAADDAMIYTIASNQVNVIQSLKATRTLIILTSGGEFTLNSDSTGTAVSPTNINIKKQSNYGASNIDALSVGNATLFVQRAKRKLRELAYNFDTDGYVAPDMTILAEDVTLSGLDELTYQQEPHSIIWGIRGDGVLVGLTYQRSEQVVAWHQHKLGGSFGATTHGIVESVISISGNSYNRTDEDQLWVIVKRTINGVTRRYVEYFTPFQFDSSLTQFQFVDSGLSYSGSATSTLTGLDHLEAQSVTVIANGSTHPNKTVSSGSITLDRTTTAAKIGLGYTSTLQTMRLDVGSQDGTSQGKTKRIFDVTLRFYETVGAKVGPDTSNLEEIPFRSSAASMDVAVPLFTGDKKIEFRGNFETDGYLFVVQDQALPMTLLSLYPRLITNDG